MINTKEFYDYLINKNMDFFTGVPDSLLKNLCSCIKENSNSKNNIIAANEGNAVGMAVGYYLATGKPGVVYMQNSGIGNTVNPLLSLSDEDVYKIPMLLIVGWRGEPNVHDEPQHVKQGKVTISLFETMGIETLILDEDYKKQIDYCCEYMKNNSKPIALIVRKNTFNSYRTEIEDSDYELSREDALCEIIKNLSGDDFIVSTTGKTSREIFEIREKNNEGHSNDFLTVGSMGHTSSIALGMSLGTSKNIYCIDGDGSFIMHMGASGIVANNASHNFKYILINNGAHESVGGQPTVGFKINIKDILKASGYNNVYESSTKDELTQNINKLKNSKKVDALIVYVHQGSREDLGRPTTTPIQNKEAIMNKLK